MISGFVLQQKLIINFGNDMSKERSFLMQLSSGIRIIGSVAIAGCLLSAIGYGISDYCS
jgi:hypothetical protein